MCDKGPIQRSPASHAAPMSREPGLAAAVARVDAIRRARQERNMAMAWSELREAQVQVHRSRTLAQADVVKGCLIGTILGALFVARR